MKDNDSKDNVGIDLTKASDAELDAYYNDITCQAAQMVFQARPNHKSAIQNTLKNMYASDAPENRQETEKAPETKEDGFFSKLLTRSK